MNNKKIMVTFVISKALYLDFDKKIAEKNIKGQTQDKKFKKLNRTSVISKLLIKFLDGKISLINSNLPANEEKTNSGILLSIELWVQLRNYLINQKINTIKISGGLGGIITNLIKQYIEREICLPWKY